MNKSLFFVAAFLVSVTASAQYPGGLRDSLKVWLKANSGITPSPTNTVTQWNEVSGANVTGNFSATINPFSLNPPGYAQAGVNFNPHVIFNAANSNSVSSLNQFTGNSIFDPNNNTVFQVLRLRPMNFTGVWFKWQSSNTTSRFGNEHNTGAGQQDRIGFDFPGLGAQREYTNTPVVNLYKIATFGTQSLREIRLNGVSDVTLFTGTFSPGTALGRLSLGGEPAGTAGGTEQYFTNVDIAEVIVYKRTLSAAERNKVESYLAVKYGVTLDQGAAAANNYTSSNGTVIWNRNNNLPFINNITGIGRDDGDSLIQRQSRSINAATPAVSVYNGTYTGATVPASNVDNTNSFTADNSYLLFGDNGLASTFTRCYTGGFLRMPRVWKTQKTGTINNVTLAVNAADVPANTRHLLVSTDSAFTPANTTVYRLDNANNILSRSVTLPGQNAYFTFASDSLVAHPTSNAPLCEGSTLQLNSNVTLASYSWTGPGGFSSTLANPTISSVTAANAGYYVLNGGTAGCTIKTDSIRITVSIKPAPPTVTTPLIYCEGDAAQPLTAVGNNLKWYSQPVGGTGTTTPPIPTTAYEDTLTYWVTQSNAGCESIRSRQIVEVRYKPNGIILGTQSSICQGDIDTFYYYGNGRATAVYDFKNPAFFSTLLSGTFQGPYVVRFDSAGSFRIRMQVNNNGCVGNEMFFDVTVRPSPAAQAVSKHDACVDEVVDVALSYTTNGVTRYNYDFDNAKLAYGTATGGPYGVSWSTPGLRVIKLLATTTGCPSRTTYDSIMVHPAPEASFTASTTNICAGDSVLLRTRETDSNTRFFWTPNYFFSTGNIYQAWGVIKAPGYVRLDVESKWGCKASDSVYITAQPCCELFFPNVFSPNNDTKNDVFRVITKGHHEIANFRIVNRWGQTVFETKDESKGWDGTYNGRDQDVGTYYYYIKYICKGNEYIEQKGELLLIR